MISRNCNLSLQTFYCALAANYSSLSLRTSSVRLFDQHNSKEISRFFNTTLTSERKKWKHKRIRNSAQRPFVYLDRTFISMRFDRSCVVYAWTLRHKIQISLYVSHFNLPFKLSVAVAAWDRWKTIQKTKNRKKLIKVFFAVIQNTINK